MFLVGLMQWWYGRGWAEEASRIGRRIKGAADFFSIGQLFKTLFSPFRQISAGRVGGSLSIQFRAFIDRLISRIVGAFVRSGTILVGLVVLFGHLLAGAVALAIWLILPILPVAGFILMAIDWIPR